MNRRAFIKGLGAFMILPGAGRIWKAARPEPAWCAREWLTLYIDEMKDLFYRIKQARGPEPRNIEVIANQEAIDFFNTFFHGHRIDGSLPPAPPPRPGFREWDLEIEQRLWKPHPAPFITWAPESPMPRR